MYYYYYNDYYYKGFVREENIGKLDICIFFIRIEQASYKNKQYSRQNQKCRSNVAKVLLGNTILIKMKQEKFLNFVSPL